MTMQHFSSQAEATKWAIEEKIEYLSEDLAAMIGTQAEFYSDEDMANTEEMIADLEAVRSALEPLFSDR